MGIKIALLFGVLVSLFVGIVCVVWPERVQEYALRWSSQGIGKVNPFFDWMKTRSYILTLRIIGVMAIGAVILLLFIIIKESKK